MAKLRKQQKNWHKKEEETEKKKKKKINPILLDYLGFQIFLFSFNLEFFFALKKHLEELLLFG